VYLVLVPQVSFVLGDIFFKLQVCLVFVPKYRKSCITLHVAERVREAFAGACADFECALLELGRERDHVHLLVAYPPEDRLVQVGQLARRR